jgi:D-alanyl-D-alanine carboxypeptidase (penicillin-binding protein 5/6)
MKKINVAITASVLIALHVLILALVINSGDDSAVPAVPSFDLTEAPAPSPAQNPIDGFTVPRLEIPSLAEEAAPRQSRIPIATPGTRAGTLRSDRPDRHTTKNFQKLINEPYQSAIVVDAHTGKILYEDRASNYAYPASVTKLMTLLIVLEQIDAGKISPDDKVEISKEVAGIGGSEVYLDVRESGFYTVDDLLKALMIHSANDAARALTLHVAGSRSAFVEMMNRKARALGMTSTRYHSEHGLPPSDGSQPDISTAYDVALLCMAALKHPETLVYTGTKLAWLPASPVREGEDFMLANRNALVGREPYPGCDGLKTGFHSRGGYSLAATANRNGKRVISVVLGVADRDSRNAITRRLLDKGFQALE